ncbi:MAG: alkaline shock response membrane anchor protein AmaP [Limnochordia bacterium]|jgi:uncharacterized alkaline shock family protein YloU
MRTIDRIIMTLAALGFLALALLAFSLPLSSGLVNELIIWFDYLARFGALETTVVGLVALLIALSLAYLAWGRRGQLPSLIKEGELGQLRISFQTVEELVHRAARDVNGVRDVHTRLRSTPQGIDITLQLKVIPDVHIPETGETVQRRVRDYLLSTTGVEVKQIQVQIQSIAREQRARVE